MVLELELEVALQLLVHMNQVLLVELEVALEVVLELDLEVALQLLVDIPKDHTLSLEVAPEVVLDVGSRTPIHGQSTMFA